mmetsp:Transcript_15036/g.30414  ORF Transcript_15036/g.30414 Transcript_15036/m.30414 type:complete len:219 (-) Transcript_15036:1468-2124(-)
MEHVGLEGHSRDTDLGFHRGGEFLSVIGPVEVFSRCVLAPCVVPPDDHLGEPVVLPADHVLDCLTGSGESHVVGEVLERDHLVSKSPVQGLIGGDSHRGVKVIVLGRSDGRMNDGGDLRSGGVGEHCDVGLVERVSALECDDLFCLLEFLPGLRGSADSPNPWTLRESDPLDGPSNVRLPHLVVHVSNVGVVSGIRAAGVECLGLLVRVPLGRDGHDG